MLIDLVKGGLVNWVVSRVCQLILWSGRLFGPLVDTGGMGGNGHYVQNDAHTFVSIPSPEDDNIFQLYTNSCI